MFAALSARVETGAVAIGSRALSRSALQVLASAAALILR
jgi:hypothetical protein